VSIADQELELDGSAPFTLGRSPDAGWQVAPPLAPGQKSPRRAGPFKSGFRHHFMLVYGTQGTPEENTWALAKARYDHEQWRYRGNGAVDVLPDVDFLSAEHPDRDVVLYGNQDTNGAWSQLLGGAFGLTRNGLRVGEHALEGDDLALLAVYPRGDSDFACVSVIGGSGLPGARTTTFLPYFVSGVGYPDWTVIGSEFLEQGLPGVRAAGYFSSGWSAEEGAESSWR